MLLSWLGRWGVEFSSFRDSSSGAGLVLRVDTQGWLKAPLQRQISYEVYGRIRTLLSLLREVV